MRLCPSIEGSASPLITHRIGADTCLSRQAGNFHKCHRCIYRGQTAEWQAEPDEPNLAAVPATGAPKSKKSGQKKVVIPRPETGAAPRAVANG